MKDENDQPVEKQVRIEGTVAKISSQRSDDYFYSRPLGSQIGAAASLQSEPLISRQLLEQQVEKIQEWHESGKQKVTRPAHWNGYCVKPNVIEFWTGRKDRIHDRLQFSFKDNNWVSTLLYP